MEIYYYGLNVQAYAILFVVVNSIAEAKTALTRGCELWNEKTVSDENVWIIKYNSELRIYRGERISV